MWHIEKSREALAEANALRSGLDVANALERFASLLLLLQQLVALLEGHHAASSSKQPDPAPTGPNENRLTIDG